MTSYTSGFNNLNLYKDQATRGLTGMSVIFSVWSLDISGGTNIILNHAAFLKRYGADVTIYTQPNQKYTNWHPALSSLNIVTDIPVKKFDVCILTWWRTIFDINKINSSVYINFVQSIESRFYFGSEYKPELSRLVEGIYNFGIPSIVVSRWIQIYLQSKYNANSFLVKNGIDKDLFNLAISPKKIFDNGKLNVLIEGPLNVDFKRTEEVLKAIQKIRKYINISVVTSNKSSDVAALSDVIYSKVPMSEMGSIYASSDVLLKASLIEGMYGPPLEMFHCGGTAISTSVTGADEYMVDKYNSRIIENPDDMDLFSFNLLELSKNKELLQSLKSGAIETARYWPSLEASSLDFASTLVVISRMCGSSLNSNIEILRSSIEKIGY